jgi:membrane-associated phospholipid phosphatase
MDTDMRRSLLFARALPTGCAMHHAELVTPACGQSLYIGKSRQLGSAPYSPSSFASLADAMSANLKTTVRPAIPRTVWVLGFVSLFMDLSTKLVHALLLVFLVGTVTMSVVALGLLERAAKATALIIKLFCGPLSDYLGRRKGLLLMGYGLAAFAKPLLAELLLGTGRSVVSVFVGVALMLLLGGARLASGLTLTAGLLVAWARVFLGIHFPLDMIGATAVACVAYTLIAPFWHFAGGGVRCVIVAYGRIIARPIDMGWLRR